MTEKFIKRHCEKCDYCLFVRRDETKEWEPDQCGEINEDGDVFVYGELERMTVQQCRKGFKK